MILTAEVGKFNLVNTYFYIDDETRHGFLIDPGDEGDKILKICADNNFTIEKILITHGHYDHIGAVNQIQYALNIPAVMNVNGKIYAENPAWNCSRYFGEEIKLGNVTYLDDGVQIVLEKNPNFFVKMIHTPGHTLDGVIYYSEVDKVAFVGDTIFKNSYGRYDLPGGNQKILFDSIRNKILTLPSDTILLSGHTPATTVDAEKFFF